jgi:lysophospholipase L1-like esterase
MGTIFNSMVLTVTPETHNISVSGTTLDQVQKLLDKSDSQVDSENVDSVVLSLGTNDVTQYRNGVLCLVHCLE